MPFHTDAPVLTVDPATIANIDPLIPENLFGMWSAFSRCSGILEHGKRLENLSWRLMNHRALSCSMKRQERFSHTHAKLDSHTLSTADTTSVPDLSSSVGSTSSIDSDGLQNTTPDSSRSSIENVKCSSTSRDQGAETEKHLTSIDLKELVVSIKEKQDLTEPIRELYPTPKPMSRSARSSQDAQATHDSTPRPSSPRPTPEEPLPRVIFHESSSSTVATVDEEALNSPTDTSSTSATSAVSHHYIVRGFLPGQESSYRSQTQLAPSPQPLSILKSSAADRLEAPKKRAGMFLLGSSSGEDEGSLERHMKRGHIPRSSLSESLKRPDGKKQTSFNEHVTEILASSSRPEDTEAVFDDTDEEEDEDDSAWENASDDGDSRPSSEINEAVFQRVDSTTNLPSRRSMLTAGLHEGDRKAALQNAASRSTPAIRRSRTSTPNGPSVAASPDEDSPLELRGTPIIRPAMVRNDNAVLSPKTTRLNMLRTEIPEELRKELLHERKQRPQKPQNADLPRRHTAQDMKPLDAYPGAAGSSAAAAALSPNYYFTHGIGEYNTTGW